MAYRQTDDYESLQLNVNSTALQMPNTILELSYTLPSHSSAIIAIITTNFDTNLSLESQNNTEWYQVRTSWEPWNGATTSHPSTWKVGSWYTVQPRGNNCNDRENQSIAQCNKT